MKRDLHLERHYFLGQFKHIKLQDTITDIPDDLMLNEKFIGLLRTLQMLDVERTFQKYYRLNEKWKDMSAESVLEMLDKARTDTYRKLEEIFRNGETETEES